MRIISGFYKGKKILEPKDIKTRPLKDLTKESIFNIIIHTKKFKINLEDATILDLFSGVGSFGLECLSRGVKKVIFVENYSGVLPILKKNLSYLKSENNYEILEKNIYDESTFLIFKNKFDIIFLDPPYKDKNIDKILSNIKKQKLLTKNGIIILHRHKNEDNKSLQNIEILEMKKYGISKIFFISLN
tara:strand:+ start:1098 stop:1661 length:564 start_codon:yes stop_codon:yes gene_type:complete